MKKEYAIYPFEFMNITQRHDEGNHALHSISVTNYSDKPWDEALQDSGRSYFCPRNDFIIEEILGINSSTTNTVRLKSINKLYIPYKEEADYLYVTLTHMNEDNLKEVGVGQILYKGSKILLEGTDGFATGNHFHVTANLGKYYGLLQNNNGKWCYTYEKSLLPNEAFYLDESYTTVLNNREYVFKPIPKEEMPIVGDPILRNEKANQIEIKIENLYSRVNPSLNAKIIGYIKPGIYNYSDVQQSDGYSWYYTDYGWINYDSDWAIIYLKEEDAPIIVDNEQKTGWFYNFFKTIFNFFKKLFGINKQ